MADSFMMRLTPKAIRDKKAKKEKIAVLTAYDFPFARMFDAAGVDVVLVGDSLGMVVLGHASTVPVTMRDMLHHTRAVSRAVKQALVVADMPFGSYAAPDQALRNALRLVKEAGADAVKLEGGRSVEKQVSRLVKAGIPVMGHIGMTPQTAGGLGGYKVQGRDPKQAAQISADAKCLDGLGVFAMVLECVPSALAAKITRQVKCPTIGIGAGAGTDGQVLVMHDMLGIESGVRPRFVRRYAELEKTVSQAAQNYLSDVRSGKFPSKTESFE